MNISRIKVFKSLICFVLVFIAFSYLSPIQAKEIRNLYYYYDSSAEYPQKSTKSTQNNPVLSTETTTNDDEDYEVYIVKVNQKKARMTNSKKLTFSQMAKAINKKQKIRNNQNTFSHFNSNKKVYF